MDNFTHANVVALLLNSLRRSLDKFYFEMTDRGVRVRDRLYSQYYIVLQDIDSVYKFILFHSPAQGYAFIQLYML